MQQKADASPKSGVAADRLLLLMLVVLGSAPYWGTFNAPFIFDDLNAIPDNPFIRSVWPIGEAMEAPRRTTVAGRPLVSLSLAFNHAVSGLEVWSYHAFNLAVHMGCVVLLYGLIRRLGRSACLQGRRPWSGRGFAFWLALTWAVHPINSETVIYVVQRTELMSAFFGLAAFGVLARSLRRAERGSSAMEQLVVVVLLVLAALSKETAVVFPLLLFFFDRAFVAGSFHAALRTRWPMYVGCLLPVAVCIDIGLGDHRGGLATGDPELTWRYLLTQGAVICHYLRLMVIPYPLLVTYHWPLADGLSDSLPWSALVFCLLAASFWALCKKPAWGFLGMLFFLVLAPTSSVIPIMSEVAGERRMYLPGIAVLVALFGGVWLVVRSGCRLGRCAASADAVCGGVAVGLVAALAVVTVVRGLDYRDRHSIWRQTVRHAPDSYIANTNYASVLVQRNRLDQAERYVRRALAIWPGRPKAMSLQGLIHSKRGQWGLASDQFMKAAMHDQGGSARDHAYAGLSFGMLGNQRAARRAFSQSFNVEPENRWALNFMGMLAAQNGEHERALKFYRRAIASSSESSLLLANIANSLNRMGRHAEARAAYREALALFPNSVSILVNYGRFEASRGELDLATDLFKRLLRISPNHEAGRLALASVLAMSEHPEADDQMRKLVTLHPENIQARRLYAQYLLGQERLPSADRQVRAGLRIDPADPDLRRYAGYLNAEREKRKKTPRDSEPGAATTPEPDAPETGPLPDRHGLETEAEMVSP